MIDRTPYEKLKHEFMLELAKAEQAKEVREVLFALLEAGKIRDAAEQLDGADLLDMFPAEAENVTRRIIELLLKDTGIILKLMNIGF